MSNGNFSLIRSTRLAVILALAAALPTLAQAQSNHTPYGPGHVFASVSEAAVDALATAHRRQLLGRTSRLSRGGTIVAVDGGYTYRAIETARPGAPDELRLRLDRNVVAHFHTYPSQGRRIDRLNEHHSRADRWVVDQLDSKRRPSYVLTPSLRVIVYRGRDEARGADVTVANLSQPSVPRKLAQR